MKTLDVIVTGMDLQKTTGKVADFGKFADTCDLIEVTLDGIPQGGFTPKDIRDRNRIQTVVDNYRKPKEKAKADKAPKPILEFEDADYENLKHIVNNSRWASRDKALQDFLDVFQK
jgi:hypothetical protein